MGRQICSCINACIRDACIDGVVMREEGHIYVYTSMCMVPFG